MILRAIFAVGFNLVFFATMLFVPAGTLAWPRAWAFLGVLLVAILATIALLFPGHQDLIDERMKPPLQEGQPRADKILTIVLLLSYVADVMLIGLDRFHLHLLPRPGNFVSSLGLVLFVTGWTTIVLAMQENRFAATIVRYQEERGQRVIDTGVYATVRHPMYLGGAQFMIGLPLFLESYAATLGALVQIAVIVWRIFVEEDLLRRELAGYEAYTERVR